MMSDEDMELLHKALYGLRDSTLYSKLCSLGLQPLFEDPCIYRHPIDELMLSLYSDDTLIAAHSFPSITQLLDTLDNAYGINRVGNPKQFLGYNITRHHDQHTITLSQIPYVQDTLHICNMEECNGRHLPIYPTYNLQPPSTFSDPSQRLDFQQIMGLMMSAQFRRWSMGSHVFSEVGYPFHLTR